MAAFDYAELAATAQELLAEFGLAVSLRRDLPGGEYDPEVGVTPPGVLEAEGVGVLIGYEQAAVNGTSVLQGDQQVYLGAGQADGTAMLQPEPQDVLAFGAAEWRVVQAEAIAPAGVPVLFIVQVRK